MQVKSTELQQNAKGTNSKAIPPICSQLLAPRRLKNCVSHIDASHSRQPLVKGERLVRYEVNAVINIVETLLTPRKKTNQQCSENSGQRWATSVPHWGHIGDHWGNIEVTLRQYWGHVEATLTIHCYPKGCAAPSFVPCQCNT